MQNQKICMVSVWLRKEATGVELRAGRFSTSHHFLYAGLVGIACCWITSPYFSARRLAIADRDA